MNHLYRRSERLFLKIDPKFDHYLYIYERINHKKYDLTDVINYWDQHSSGYQDVVTYFERRRTFLKEACVFGRFLVRAGAVLVAMWQFLGGQQRRKKASISNVILSATVGDVWRAAAF